MKIKHSCVYEIFVPTTLLVSLLAGSACSKTGEQRPTQAASTGLEQRLTGKWELTGIPVEHTLEFLPSGDFSVETEGTRRGAGTYKFIDSKHLRLDIDEMAVQGLTGIYEIESLSETEMKLRSGSKTEVWQRVKGGLPRK